MVRWLVSAVQRAYLPSSEAHSSLLLIGGQGVGKTTFFKIMGLGQYYDLLSSEDSLNDTRQKIARCWIAELGEFGSYNRAKDMEALKAFLTASSDTFRPPYGTAPEDHLRHCVFGASSNEENPLDDATGNRRFWPVFCHNPFDLQALAEYRDTIWSCARDLFLQNYPTIFSPQESQALARHTSQAEVEGLYDSLIGSIVDRGLSAYPQGFVLQPGAIWEALNGFGVAKNRRAQMELAAAFRKFGFTKTTLRIEGVPTAVWRIRSGQESIGATHLLNWVKFTNSAVNVES
jgi:hypothetical protein